MTGRLLFLVALLSLLPPTPARAESFYSIDITTDELVIIDSSSGTVTAVGPIGYNFGGAALTLHGGVLYAVNTPLCVAGVVDLVSIDHVTGARIAVVRVKVGASDLVASAADGLTSDGATMLLSYRTSGACGASHVLADLATSGATTNQTAFANTRDMDNLAWSPGGDLIGLDGVVGSPNNHTDVYIVARPATYTLRGTHVNAGSDGYAGALFTPGGDLWTWGFASRTLRRLDPGNGQPLATVSVGTTRTLRGLANAPTPPTPVEPTTWGRLKVVLR